MKYTPKQITEAQSIYSIPIYQRLFEWNSENIITLLEDLKKEYEQTEGEGDYYIGMLTSTKDNELVDGQQRFTVMMLLGCVLQNYDDCWKNFLLVDNKLRIDFTSRPSDYIYLMSLVEQVEKEKVRYKNLKMQNGWKIIKDFMEDKNRFSPEERNAFSIYVFYHLSFFISNLPEGYNPKDLNKYFERMNTSGKNLEQHEILKVKLLSNLDYGEKYMLLWNKLADVDTLLIRSHTDDNLAERKWKAMHSDISTILSENLFNGMEKDGDYDDISIADIEASSSSPKNKRELNRNSWCALSFPYLLLQVLYRKVGKKISCSLQDFFNPSNLLSTFEAYLPFSGNRVNKGDIQDFMERLVKARLALDICFIRPTEYGYSLDLNLEEDDGNLKNLMMFQSMIYVSSSNYTHYRWFNWLMDEVDQYGIPDAVAMYRTLKKNVDKTFILPSYEQLSYRGDNHYWFWRLDFYIWQHRKDLFDKNSRELKIAENYVFRRNRSIEHVAPQTPQSNSTMKWENTDEDARLRDSFGNLVMISNGLNSALSNESYEVKMAHVQSYSSGAKSGSIESLKLLVIYNDYPDGWTKSRIEEHGHKMYEWLAKSLDVLNEAE